MNEFGRFKHSVFKTKNTDHSSNTATLMVDAFGVPLYYKQKDEDGNYLTNDVLQQFNSLGILLLKHYMRQKIINSLILEHKVQPCLNGKLQKRKTMELYCMMLYSMWKQEIFLNQYM